MAERMAGKVSFNNLPDGQEYDFEFVVTIESDDIETMINDPSHSAKLSGYVLCKGLSSEPLPISSGVFNLFVDSESEIDGKEMRYNFKMDSVEGKCYRFQGTKYIKKTSVIETGWENTTTLYVHIFSGAQSAEVEIASGILKITVKDLSKQIPDIKITNTDSWLVQTKWKAKFYKFFAETIWYTYFSVLGKDDLLNPDNPRQIRELNVCGAIAETYPVLTSDNVPLTLTRYNAGPKGPLLCLHGLSNGRSLFNIDTIPVNFVEFFGQSGYDIWLLDDRQSLFTYHTTPPICHREGIDSIGKYDVPAAVDAVLEMTGKKNLQVFAHCQGAFATEMAIARGLVKDKIRAFVASQSIFTPVGSTFNWLKSVALGYDQVRNVLDATVGIPVVTAYTDTKAGVLDTMLNCAVRGIAYSATPREEHGESAVCHRISTFYGVLFQHDNVNVETHKTLHELFGIGHGSYCHHMMMFLNNEKLVDKSGEDVYIPGVDSKGNFEVDVRDHDWVRHVDIPMYLLIGSENQVFRPPGVERTYEMLKKLHPDQDYIYANILGYGQIDILFGKNAVTDVWPGVLSFLDKYAEGET